jgi:hypothetical protein
MCSGGAARAARKLSQKTSNKVKSSQDHKPKQQTSSRISLGISYLSIVLFPHIAVLGSFSTAHLMRISSCLLLLALSHSRGALQRPALNRRAVLSGAAGTLLAGLRAQPVSAGSLSGELREAEAALQAATGNEAINDALERLLNVVTDYGGLPTPQLTEELVVAMRDKRTTAQQQGDKVWNGITEESYNRLMRSVDPWRTIELQPALARSIYSFPLACAPTLHPSSHAFL